MSAYGTTGREATDDLLGTIKLAKTRDDVVPVYANYCGKDVAAGVIDWPRINSAIIDRWSLNALVYIKNRAWTHPL